MAGGSVRDTQVEAAGFLRNCIHSSRSVSLNRQLALALAEGIGEQVSFPRPSSDCARVEAAEIGGCLLRVKEAELSISAGREPLNSVKLSECKAATASFCRVAGGITSAAEIFCVGSVRLMQLNVTPHENRSSSALGPSPTRPWKRALVPSCRAACQALGDRRWSAQGGTLGTAPPLRSRPALRTL
jgi:hypothetical protein